MASRRHAASGALAAYSPAKREEWLFALKQELRASCRFGLQLLEGAHERPVGAPSAVASDDEAGDEFAVQRLSQSSAGLIVGEGESTSSDDDDVTQAEQLELSATLADAVSRLVVQSRERTREGEMARGMAAGPRTSAAAAGGSDASRAAPAPEGGEWEEPTKARAMPRPVTPPAPHQHMSTAAPTRPTAKGIFPSTGDLALANIVAQRHGINWQRVRKEMARKKDHWAHKAAYATLLTCNVCLVPSWPDCNCAGREGGASQPLVRSHQMERCYNYVDKPHQNPATIFHRRMGHMPVRRLLQAFKDGGDHGIPGLTAERIRALPWCADCAACKQTRKPHKKLGASRRRATSINAVIHTDTMERTIASLPPERFTKIQVFVDEFTRYLWVRFARSKTAEEFTQLLESFEHAAQIQHRSSCQWKGGPGTPVLAYFSDNAGELIGRRQKRRLAEKLIELQLSTPGESQANGIAERANRLVLDTTRILLYQAGLPLPFWKLAAQMAVWILNRSPSSANPGNKSPYELYFGKPPDRGKLRRFGCKCWVWQPKENRPNRSKLDPTASPMIFVGYTEHGTHGFRVWDPNTQRVKIRYSLIFEEDANMGVVLGRRPKKEPLAIEDADIQGESEDGRAIDPGGHTPPLAIDTGEDDGWSQLYTVTDEETLMDIGRRLHVDPLLLQQKNLGIEGGHPRTGQVPIDAPLEGGTEIWVPTGAKESVPSDSEGAGSEGEPEASNEGPSPPEGDGSWKGRLRNRKRSALKIEYEQDEADSTASALPRHMREVGATAASSPAAVRSPQGKHKALLLRTQRDIEDLLKSDDDVVTLKATLSVAAQELAQEKLGPTGPLPAKVLSDLRQDRHFGQPENQWLYANSAKSAAKHDRADCLSWILDRGTNVDTSTKSGNTLLHLAGYHGNADICLMLLERGSRPDFRNKRGEEPWEAAEAGGSKQCAKLLKEWPNLDPDLLDDPTSARDPDTEQGELALTLTNDEEQELRCAATLDTSHLLERVLERAKTAIRIQARPSMLQRERKKVEALCEAAHEDFARAYMMERMLLVESLRGVAARDIPTPKNYKEAVASEFADWWNDAIMEEIRNLENFGTWEWVPRPRDRHLIDSCWSFRVKANQKGEVDRMKARLCARGFREIWGQDYVETHAPVTCLTSWRACLAQAAKHRRHVDIFDIKSAYLMADVKEDIYMSVPDGVVPPRPGLVMKLRRSLYGLKQAGRYFNQLLSSKLKAMGLRQSKADPCLFLKGQGADLMTLNVHVDDCCVTYSNERQYRDFRCRLEKEFQISKSDDSNTFLGMVIERLGERGPIYIHQRPYITDILARFKHTDCKVASTAAEPGLKLSKAQMPTTDAAKSAMKGTPYKQLVGALLYLANCTRPDIAQAVSSCARFAGNPGPVHWKALKHVLRYLKGTQGLGIVFGKRFAEGIPHNDVHGYVDGDWGGDPDDRRSTTGFVYMSFGGPICWRSKKQASTALSSCESEYMAASEAAKEAIWLTRLYQEDLGIADVSLETKGDLTESEYEGAKPLTVFEDNVGCINMSKNPVMHRASKHIEIRYHFVRERVRDGSLKLVFIPSSENVADILTKPTRRQVFLYLRNKIMHDPSMGVKQEPARVMLVRTLSDGAAEGASEHPETAEEDFLRAVEAHLLHRPFYPTWEGETAYCDEIPDEKPSSPPARAFAMRTLAGRQHTSALMTLRTVYPDSPPRVYCIPAKEAAYVAAQAAAAASDAALGARFEVACMGPATWDLSDIPVTWNYDQTWVGGTAPNWLPVNMKWSSATAYATQLRRDPLYREGVAPEYLVVRPGKVSGPYNRFRWPHGYGDWRRRLYTVTWEGQSMREVAHHFRIDPARLQRFNADMWTEKLIPLDWHMPRGTSVWVPTPWSIGDHTDSDWLSDESTDAEESKGDAPALPAPLPSEFGDRSSDSEECCCPWDPHACLGLCDKPPFFSDHEPQIDMALLMRETAEEAFMDSIEANTLATPVFPSWEGEPMLIDIA